MLKLWQHVCGERGVEACLAYHKLFILRHYLRGLVEDGLAIVEVEWYLLLANVKVGKSPFALPRGHLLGLLVSLVHLLLSSSH